MAGKIRWQEAPGQVEGSKVLTDPTGRVTIEKVYGPWVVRDIVDEYRVGEYANERDAKQIAEGYLADLSAPTPEELDARARRRIAAEAETPAFEGQCVALAGEHYRRHVLAAAAMLRSMADRVERLTEPRTIGVGEPARIPYTDQAAAVVSEVTDGVNNLGLGSMLRLAAEADVAVEKLRAARGQ